MMMTPGGLALSGKLQVFVVLHDAVRGVIALTFSTGIFVPWQIYPIVRTRRTRIDRDNQRQVSDDCKGSCLSMNSTFMPGELGQVIQARLPDRN